MTDPTATDPTRTAPPSAAPSSIAPSHSAPGLTEKQRMVSGRTYRSSDPDLTSERAHAKRVLHDYNSSHPDDEAHRAELLRGLLGGMGEHVWLEPPFRCDYGSNITVGTGVYANYDLTILDCAPVTIGDLVLFGPRVTISTASHPVDHDQRVVDLYENALPVTIEDGVWLGAHVVVNPGVTIGARSVVGAGSVVTSDVPPDVVAAGVPARVLRPITEADRAAYLAAHGAYDE